MRRKRILPKFDKGKTYIAQDILPEVTVTPDGKVDPWAMPTVEQFVQANLKRYMPGIKVTYPRNINPLYNLLLRHYDDGKDPEEEFKKGVDDTTAYYESQGYRDRVALGDTINGATFGENGTTKKYDPTVDLPVEIGDSTEAVIEQQSRPYVDKYGIEQYDTTYIPRKIIYNPYEKPLTYNPEQNRYDRNQSFMVGLGAQTSNEAVPIGKDYNVYEQDEFNPYIQGAHERAHVGNPEPAMQSEGYGMPKQDKYPYNQEMLDDMSEREQELFYNSHDGQSKEIYADAIASGIMLTKLGIYDRTRSIYNEDGSRYEFTKDMYNAYMKTPEGKNDRFAKSYGYEKFKKMMEDLAYQNNSSNDMYYAYFGKSPRKILHL